MGCVRLLIVLKTITRIKQKEASYNNLYMSLILKQHVEEEASVMGEEGMVHQ
jgi:hypothetical protein